MEDGSSADLDDLRASRRRSTSAESEAACPLPETAARIGQPRPGRAARQGFDRQHLLIEDKSEVAGGLVSKSFQVRGKVASGRFLFPGW